MHWDQNKSTVGPDARDATAPTLIHTPHLDTAMSLFSEVGKKFEETKQTFTSDEDDEYVCRSCEETTASDHDHCPHCGEQAVELVG